MAMNQTVSVRIPEYLHTKLVKISQREGVSIISMMEDALSDYLEARENVERRDTFDPDVPGRGITGG
jgi:predicted transcriptional regulator